jgi:hypothetical protein
MFKLLAMGSFNLLLVVLLLFGGTSQVVAEEVESAVQQYETAKMNFIIGEQELARDQFSELESILRPVKDKTDENRDLYANVMYNLGLLYEDKYEEDAAANPLEGGSTEDLLTAQNYFEQADPQIYKTIASIDGDASADYKTRAVGGIVGKVIKGKVKEWLASKDNCNCTFTTTELNEAGNVFVTVTEKEDVPALKDTNSRQKKIQEIFLRIHNYVNSLTAGSPVKTLYTTKIKAKCKL